MKRSGVSISPVLLELILVILFFALSATAAVRLIAAAAELSRSGEKKSEQLIALTDVMERIKAEPGAYTEAHTLESNGVAVAASVVRTADAAGAYYAITVTAGADETACTLSGGRYVPAGEDAP